MNAATRARIVDGAIACFDRWGMRKTTMDDIARAAEVSRKTVYNYFGSKTNLIAQVIEDETVAVCAEASGRIDLTLRDELLIAETEMSLLDAIRASAYIELVLGDESHSLALDVVGHSERIRATVARYWSPVLDELERRGALRPDTTRGQILTWIMTVHVMLASRPTTLDDTPEAIRESLRLFLAPAITGRAPNRA